MGEQEKKSQRIYDLLNTETTIYKAKKNSFWEKELFKEKGEWRIEQKMKRRLFNCSLLQWLRGTLQHQ